MLMNYLRYRNKEEFDISVALPRGSLLKPELEALGAQVYEVDGMADRLLRPQGHPAFEAADRQGEARYRAHPRFPVRPDRRPPDGLPGGLYQALRLSGARQAEIPARTVDQQAGQ